MAYTLRDVTPHPALSPEGRGKRVDLSLALSLVAAKLVLNGIDEGLPGGLDDVVGYAHRAPRLVAIARGDEHARLGPRAFALVEDAHLVVEQAHFSKIRVELLEGFPERMVEGIDGPIARGRRVFGHPLDPEAHRGLGERLGVSLVLLDDDAEAVQLEIGPVVAERALHEELERRLRTLELEALVLHPLEHVEDASRLGRVLVEIDAVLFGLPQDIGLPGQDRKSTR